MQMKSMIAFILAVSLSLTIVAISSDNDAVVQEGDNVAYVESTGQQYATLAEAFDVAVDGDNVLLMDDVASSGTILISDNRYITLDLNEHEIGFALNCNFKITHGGLIITGSGTVYEEFPYYGPVMIEADTDLNPKENNIRLIIGEDVTLRGWAPIFIDKNDENNVYGLIVDVYGKLESVLDIKNAPGHGLYVNGSITAMDELVPIINIHETAKITSFGNGMYLAGYANTTVYGGTITGETGIEIRAGDLEIYGGTISATGTDFDSAPNGNGSTTNGVAIVVSQHTTALPMDVNVYDGTFKGIYAFYQVTTDDKNNDPSKVSVSIQGGTFSSTSDDPQYGPIYSEDKEGFIIGGKFIGIDSDTERKYLATDVSLSDDDEAVSANSVAMTSDGLKFPTVKAAVAHAKNADVGTITILKNVDLTDAGVMDVSGLTIDLGGNTICASNFSLIFQGVDFTLKNGTFDSKGGNYALFVGDEGTTDNVILDGLILKGGINVYNAINVTIRDVTVTGTNYYAIWCDENGHVSVESGEFSSPGNYVVGLSTTDSELNISGGTFIVTEGKGLVLQGNYDTPVITGGSFINADSKEIEQYVPPELAVNVRDDGSIIVSEPDPETVYDITVDDFLALGKMKNGVLIFNLDRNYRISDESGIVKFVNLTDQMYESIIINGNGHTVFGSLYFDPVYNEGDSKSYSIVIDNLNIDGSDSKNPDWTYGISIQNQSPARDVPRHIDFTMTGGSVSNCDAKGIYITTATSVTISGVNISNCATSSNFTGAYYTKGDYSVDIDITGIDGAVIDISDVTFSGPNGDVAALKIAQRGGAGDDPALWGEATITSVRLSSLDFSASEAPTNIMLGSEPSTADDPSDDEVRTYNSAFPVEMTAKGVTKLSVWGADRQPANGHNLMLTLSDGSVLRTSGEKGNEDGSISMELVSGSATVSGQLLPSMTLVSDEDAVTFDRFENLGGKLVLESEPDYPYIPDDDDDYVPPIYVPGDTSSSDDDTVKIVACAAAAVVAAIMAAFLILGHRRE